MILGEQPVGNENEQFTSSPESILLYESSMHLPQVCLVSLSIDFHFYPRAMHKSLLIQRPFVSALVLTCVHFKV